MDKVFFRSAHGLAGLLLCLSCFAASTAVAQTLNFGVINQRSLQLTAEYWNPLLSYVNAKAGVQLVLKMGKTAPETTAMSVRGEHAFVYTNHLFTPERAALGYRVILRTNADDIQAALIVGEASPVRSLQALAGKPVVFPSPEAFVGYWVPMDHLLHAKVTVNATFGGNQEGAMGQLEAGNAAAAGVNKQELMKYAKRTGFAYRILWESEPYRSIPIMAHSSVPEHVAQRVRDAFLSMADDPNGVEALKQSAAALKQDKIIRFFPADDADYENYRQFYRETLVKP